MRIESGQRKIINHGFFKGQGKSTLVSKICNLHDSASLVVDCKSLKLGWISLSLYKAVVDSYNLIYIPSLLGQKMAMPSTASLCSIV